jgi:hypothetical protein
MISIFKIVFDLTDKKKKKNLVNYHKGKVKARRLWATSRKDKVFRFYIVNLNYSFFILSTHTTFLSALTQSLASVLSKSAGNQATCKGFWVPKTVTKHKI